MQKLSQEGSGGASNFLRGHSLKRILGLFFSHIDLGKKKGEFNLKNDNIQLYSLLKILVNLDDIASTEYFEHVSMANSFGH